jgi:hypothetical protein
VSGLKKGAPAPVEEAAELSAAIAAARARVEAHLAEAQRAASVVRQARAQGDRSAERDATESFELAKRRAVREAQSMRVATAEQLDLAQSLVEAAKALSVGPAEVPTPSGAGGVGSSRDHARRRGIRR